MRLLYVLGLTTAFLLGSASAFADEPTTDGTIFEELKEGWGGPQQQQQQQAKKHQHYPRLRNHPNSHNAWYCWAYPTYGFSPGYWWVHYNRAFAANRAWTLCVTQYGSCWVNCRPTWVR